MCVWVPSLLCPFSGLHVAKNATTTPSSISEREASIKFQFFLLSASWPPWNLIIVMYCPKCSPRPGHKRQPIPLPAKLSAEYWSYFKPFDSVSQENFLNVLYYSRNEWTHKLWMGRVGQSRSLCIILFSTWQSPSFSELKGFSTRRFVINHLCWRDLLTFTAQMSNLRRYLWIMMALFACLRIMFLGEYLYAYAYFIIQAVNV